MYDGCGTGLFACIMYIIFICQMCHAMDLHASMQVVLQQCPLSISPTWSSRSKSYNISFVTQLYPLHLRHDFSSESQWQTQHRWASTFEWKTALSCRRFFSTHCRRESYTSLDTCARSALTTVDNVNTSSLCVNHVNSRCEQLHEMIWWISHMQDHPSF